MVLLRHGKCVPVKTEEQQANGIVYYAAGHRRRSGLAAARRWQALPRAGALAPRHRREVSAPRHAKGIAQPRPSL